MEQKCTCQVGEVCEFCKELSMQALQYAQAFGPAGAMEAYYRKLQELREKAARDE